MGFIRKISRLKIGLRKGEVVVREAKVHAAKKRDPYPKWKHLIPTNPTMNQFEAAWITIFKRPLEECNILRAGGNDVNFGFTIEFKGGGGVSHGGFGFHTETPDVKEEKYTDSFSDGFYYTGCGCTWAVDQSGVRYHQINRSTLLPHRWEEVKAAEIIRVFLNNPDNLKRFTQQSQGLLNKN